MHRADRLFELIQELRAARGPVTAAQLAERLEVTPRTIYRDVASLQGMRVPIDGEAGIGYVMRRGYDLPPLMFSAEEVEAITVGLNLLVRTGDTGLQASARSVAAKIAAVMPAEQANQSALTDHALQVSDWGIPVPDLDMGMIRQCVRHEMSLRINYTDAGGQNSAREILPLAVTYHAEVIIIAAWCETRKDFRHFRADRIASCEETGTSFKDRGHDLRQQWHQDVNRINYERTTP
ncbi:MAG: YafY family transcriptional regulator [Rhodospirillales bacterium]|jgi:predicted DNA-binding transcriptional regulator YafY|nr:YafY family transcriptional regulator [Rhodospirillales bacterium]MBT4040475.1 YafY family transcriptional regulator [Rhodospirillales bacterium]MBT5350755.1 YafY family transcriptional regulator [Rhodospirillales bacterium]MBT5521404.1 YafY family transcriptional regulator [Rhodospirillales bacterium]MBT6108498.1 YafY family transcriptional regulator [Rhodospirillales bacterium]